VQIYNSFDEIRDIPNPVLTIGTFDGVHVGHQMILNKLNSVAESVRGESVLFTFFPHPRMVLNPTSHGIKLIQSQEEKYEKLKSLGLKHLIVCPFTTDFSSLTANDFLENYLINKLHIHTIIVGYDHQFGNNREGNLPFLIEQGEIKGFNVIEIPAQDINEVNVSSSKIRNALYKGDIAIANHYLGSPYQLKGTVVKGSQLGRKIGYPTANIEVSDQLKLIPSNGVYAVKFVCENNISFFGMMNIGHRPTIEETTKIHLEGHLFDFSSILYGQELTILFYSFVRREQKFDTLELLIQQLKKDENNIRAYFSC
jgi:riboflavin kinase/FMN adenylyltransferase